MKTFNDSAGRTWTVDINVDTIKRVRDLTKTDDERGVNLLEVVEGKLIDRLEADPILLVDVLYIVCKPEADKQNVSDEDFGRAMRGDAIANGTKALLEDLADFFPEGKRQMIRKVLAKMETLRARAMAAVGARIDSQELDQLLERALNVSSGSLPASSASTPDPSLYASSLLSTKDEPLITGSTPHS
jgi:hypothetical protein